MSDQRDGDLNKETRELVRQAAESFDRELLTLAYHDTHSDASHLSWMLSPFNAKAPHKILDLGTGNGYVAIAAAEWLPNAHVTGLDIASHTINQNKRRARERGISNVTFQLGNGVTLPFAGDSFDAVVTRYAYHHFPEPRRSLSEINRILRPGGTLVLSDAVRHDQDESDFINAFQQLKQDGHVEMLHSDRLIATIVRQGFSLENALHTTLSFDRKRDKNHDALIDETRSAVLDCYQTRILHETIRLTFPVFTGVFKNAVDN